MFPRSISSTVLAIAFVLAQASTWLHEVKHPVITDHDCVVCQIGGQQHHALPSVDFFIPVKSFSVTVNPFVVHSFFRISSRYFSSRAPPVSF